MASRRSFGYDQSMLTQPASAMSPRGGQPIKPDDDPMMQYGGEHPDTMRRRITPMVGEPQDAKTTLQEMLAMMNGGQ